MTVYSKGKCDQGICISWMEKNSDVPIQLIFIDSDMFISKILATNSPAINTRNKVFAWLTYSNFNCIIIKLLQFFQELSETNCARKAHGKIHSDNEDHSNYQSTQHDVPIFERSYFGSSETPQSNNNEKFDESKSCDYAEELTIESPTGPEVNHNGITICKLNTH